MAVIEFKLVAEGAGFFAMRASGEVGDIYHLKIPERGSVPFAFLTKGKTKLLDETFQPHPMGEYTIRTRANPPPGNVTVCMLEPTEWVCVGHYNDYWINGELIELIAGEKVVVSKGKQIFIAEGSVELNRKIKNVNSLMQVISGDITLIGTEDTLILVFEPVIP